MSQATARYEQIASDLSKFVGDITEIVAFCCDIRELYPTQDVKTRIMVLYGLVFKFLNDVLDWYLEKWYKKLLKSFNENLHSDFDDQVKDVLKCANAIKDRVVVLAQGAEIRSTRQTSELTQLMIADIGDAQEQLASLSQKGYRSMREEQKRRDEEFNRSQLASREQQLRRNSELKLDIQQLCYATWQEMARTQMGSKQSLLLPADSPNSRPRSVVTAEGTVVEPTTLDLTLTTILPGILVERDEVLRASSCLEAFFDRDRIRIACRPDSAALSPEAMANVQDWIVATTPSLLVLALPESSAISRICGVYGAIAANFIDVAARVPIPVISYFCTLTRIEDDCVKTTPEEKGLVALVYALVRQLLEIAPPNMDTDRDFSVERFAALDGTPATFPQALDLLHDALMLGPPMLYCVIDGLQWLDDASTQGMLDDLLKLLRTELDSCREAKINLKLLFTTSGQSRCLLRCDLSRSEYVLDEGRAVTLTDMPMARASSFPENDAM